MTDTSQADDGWLICDQCCTHFRSRVTHRCPVPDMTAHTTRERVENAIYASWEAQGGTLNDIGRRHLSRLAADAALAAMQPPTETRWEVSDWTVESFALTAGTARERLRKALPNLLRDFADGVSDEVLERAWEKADDSFGTNGYLRNILRALADQEEGK